jgi:PAS domain S-box-containing protein
MDFSELNGFIDNLQGLAFRYTYGGDNAIQYVNSYSQELFGKAPQELIGKPSQLLFEGVTDNDLLDIRNIIEKAVKTNKAFQVEYEQVNSQGKTRWRVLQGKVVHRNEYSILMVEGFIQNITLRKNSELSLRKMKNFHKNAHEELGDKLHYRKIEIEQKNAQLNVLNKGIDKACIVATSDLKGKIIDINDMYCQVSCYSREEILKKKPQIISYEKHKNDFYKELWVTISSGKIWRGEIQSKTKHGELYWLDAIIVPFLDKHNKPYQFFSISTLITDRKKTEQELQEKAKEIEKKNIALQEQQIQIEKQSDSLRKVHQNITQSIEYAKYLQSAILPHQDKICTYFSSFFALYQPKDVVSGDFYWFYHDEKEQQSFVAVVDCTGHGVPGGFMSMLGYELLENIVAERRIYRPDVVLEEMDKGIVRLLKQKNSNTIVRDGMEMSFVRVDHLKRRLVYSGARSSIIIERQSEIIEYKPTKHSIGSFEDEVEKEFEKQTINYQSADKLYLFTDGFIDQFGGIQGKKYYKNRFKNLLSSNSRNNLKSIKNNLTSELNSWKGRLEQVDDITVLGVKLH